MKKTAVYTLPWINLNNSFLIRDDNVEMQFKLEKLKDLKAISNWYY